jgi:phosphodiesterase/alkaline phosphatase D-like protein
MLEFNEIFDENFYQSQNPNIPQGVTPFDHFQQVGQFQGISPSPLFDTNYYLVNNPDISSILESSGISPYQHYIQTGQFEGRKASPLYNEDFYLESNPEVADAVNQDILTGVEHFFKFGQFEGRRPSVFYEENYYLTQNPGVAEAVERDELTGIEHYLGFGAGERRELTPFIDGSSTLPNAVASGDTTQTSTVLWTRTIVPGPVTFDYSTDGNFSTFESQTTTATDPTIPVQIEVTGLEPNTQYFYRATDRFGTTEIGQFKTLAPLGTQTGLRFGVSGDWQGELGPFPSISNVDDRNLDFFVQLGDTLEADSISPDLPEIRQSENYSQFLTKHNEIYSPRFGINNWADLRESTTVYATWDDHDITNDFAGGAAPADSPQRNEIFGSAETGFVNDTSVFDSALRAFLDFKPLREEFYGETGDPRTANERKLYRFNVHGDDAATFVLDTRSFRDAPLPFLPETASSEEVNQYLEDAFEPDRTMLGAVQLQELKDDLLAAENGGITWKFVMSTVPMQHYGIPVAGERWEGFAAERTDLLRFITENDIDNVVFVTGDFHGNAVNDVTYSEGVGQPQIPTGAFDVTIGPVGIQLNIGDGPFAAPFGAATVAFTPDELLPESEKERYQTLSREEKNAFVRQVVDNRIVPLGYTPIGLEDSNIDAQLLQGSYIAAHNYGWSEFDIDPVTQQLTVTTYGVEPYTADEIAANPEAIATQTPFVASQFVVNPETDDPTTPLPSPQLPSAAEEVVRNVSQEFGVSAEEQTIVTATRQEWPDGCLGLGGPGIFCTQAIVPGWQVIVESGEQRFVYRTDESGSQVALDEEASVLP